MRLVAIIFNSADIEHFHVIESSVEQSDLESTRNACKSIRKGWKLKFSELGLYGNLREDSCLCFQGGGSNISAYY